MTAEEPRPAVLVVDDEALNLDFVRRTLKGVSDVVTCLDFNEALAALDERQFDLLLTDQRLSERSGADLVR